MKGFILFIVAPAYRNWHRSMIGAPIRLHQNQISAWNRTAEAAGVSSEFSKCLYPSGEPPREKEGAGICRDRQALRGDRKVEGGGGSPGDPVSKKKRITKSVEEKKAMIEVVHPVLSINRFRHPYWLDFYRMWLMLILSVLNDVHNARRLYQTHPLRFLSRSHYE